MVTFGSSPSAGRGVSDGPAKDSVKRVRIAIPVTLVVGLVVAAGYVGSRIIGSRPQQATPVAKIVASAPSSAPIKDPAPAPVAPPSAAPMASAPAKTTRPESSKVQDDEIADEKPAEPVKPRPAVQAANSDGNSADDLISPRHGDRYLQIAAIPATAAAKFLASLERRNLQASVAPGPHDGLVRVVIGPFSDRDSVAALKAQIQANWPDCFVRLY